MHCQPGRLGGRLTSSFLTFLAASLGLLPTTPRRAERRDGQTDCAFSSARQDPDDVCDGRLRQGRRW